MRDTLPVHWDCESHSDICIFSKDPASQVSRRIKNGKNNGYKTVKIYFAAFKEIYLLVA